MKTILISFLLLLVVFNASATDADMFAIDKAKIYSELSELTLLENQIYAVVDNSLSAEPDANVALDNSLSNTSLSVLKPEGGIDESAFWLGCCLGPIGVAIIIANSESDGEIIAKSILGCVVPSGLFTLGVITKDPFLIHLAIEIFVEVFED
jgi:hypothetical protein